jgi:glyoxylase I family protein
MAITLSGPCPLLQVFDMPLALGFYRDVLGFRVLQSSGEGDQVGWVWLGLGDAQLMLNTAYDEGERPSGPDPARVAAHQDTILFFGCRDLDGVHAHLAAPTIHADPPRTTHYGMRQVYATDPDGYLVCFQWPAEARDPPPRNPPAGPKAR